MRHPAYYYNSPTKHKWDGNDVRNKADGAKGPWTSHYFRSDFIFVSLLIRRSSFILSKELRVCCAGGFSLYWDVRESVSTVTKGSKYKYFSLLVDLARKLGNVFPIKILYWVKTCDPGLRRKATAAHTSWSLPWWCALYFQPLLTSICFIKVYKIGQFSWGLCCKAEIDSFFSRHFNNAEWFKTF